VSIDRPAAADSVSHIAAVITDGSADPSGKSVPGPALPRETGGRGGLEPTRFGDWEKNGRCIDF
jgi:hypothetical protein